VTSSVALRFDLLVNGPYITSNSSVWLSPNRQLLKILPVDLPIRAWPFAIFALKNRTLSPVVERFIECAREVAKSIAILNGPKKCDPQTARGQGSSDRAMSPLGPTRTN
jgi:hypothetical protein